MATESVAQAYGGGSPAPAVFVKVNWRNRL